ncbi:hypothetical protein XELAEV_18034812mg [Xenopus laevis]|uniref:Mid2 domain-containing protein n=1 Tax=Xenopus laevis TaxID=8355 RepID=A0A974CEL3_XENLA|nr:hypothetical protein XELAEV_18034812mg [Xenopus laevis]
MDARLSMITTGGYPESSMITTGGYPESSMITTGGYLETNTTTSNSTTNLITTTPHNANNITTTPHNANNNALAIGLGVGIPCGVLLLVGIAVLIYFLIKRRNNQGLCNTKKEEKEPSENEYETTMPIPRVKPTNNTYYNISLNHYESAPDDPIYERTLNLK